MASCAAFKLLFIAGTWIPIDKYLTKFQKFIYSVYKCFVVLSSFLCQLLQIINLSNINDVTEFNEIFFLEMSMLLTTIKMTNLLLSRKIIIKFCEILKKPLLQPMSPIELDIEKNCNIKNRSSNCVFL